jgi:hypothetical protein
MTVAQGLSIQIVERGQPFDDPSGGQGEFQRARVLWLGYSPGVEWLHDEANRRLAESVSGWYYVSSDRRTAHVGAAGEVERLVLEFLGAGIAGKVISDLIDFARDRVREYRDGLGISEPPPDFSDWELDDLLGRLRDELAGVVDIPPERLELTGEQLETRMLATTSFRDTSTGTVYRVEIAKAEVTFTRQSSD